MIIIKFFSKYKFNITIVKKVSLSNRGNVKKLSKNCV